VVFNVLYRQLVYSQFSIVVNLVFVSHWAPSCLEAHQRGSTGLSASRSSVGWINRTARTEWHARLPWGPCLTASFTVLRRA